MRDFKNKLIATWNIWFKGYKFIVSDKIQMTGKSEFKDNIVLGDDAVVTGFYYEALD